VITVECKTHPHIMFRLKPQTAAIAKNRWMCSYMTVICKCFKRVLARLKFKCSHELFKESVLKFLKFFFFK